MSDRTERDIEVIRRIATNFRKDICDGRIKFPFSEDFPNGCCGSASNLLMKVVINNDFPDIIYNSGWRNENSRLA